MAEQLTGWRRTIHRHPELGFTEQRTAELAAAALEQLGCRVRRGVGRTGLTADLGSQGPLIAIRADMDALPIHEQSGAAYTSETPGVMHACGHDAHTAMALGAAALLAKRLAV
ncbi:MAG: M20/M25/M40 family metallo-hydrolase, partial [Chloroflexota bacterium]